jgi:hypothetical protein
LISGSLTGFISSSGCLTNNKTIRHAYLGISGGLANSGSITDCQPGIAADGSYQVSSGDITNNATGTIANSVLLTSGNITNNGSITLAAKFPPPASRGN